MNCPKCGGEIFVVGKDIYQCKICNSQFKKSYKHPTAKSELEISTYENPRKCATPENAEFCAQKTEAVGNGEQASGTDGSGDASVFEQSQSSAREIAELRTRLAAMEAKQTELFGKNRVNDKLEKINFIRKYGKIVFPAVLVLIAAVILMVCFIGVRGIYVSAENPNTYYEFTATGYKCVSEDEWGEFKEEGKWKISGGRLMLTVNDELFGEVSEYYKFSRNGYRTIFIDEKEYNRVSLVGLDIVPKIKVSIDLQGGTAIGDTSQMRIKPGQKRIEPENPQRAEYTFMGWYMSPFGYFDGETAYSFDYKIWNKCIIYANWRFHSMYTISGVFGEFEAYPDYNLLRLLEERGHEVLDFYQYKKIGSTEWIDIDRNTRLPKANIEIKEKNMLYFGEYPQTIKDEEIIITDAPKDSRGYYLGSDGAYYAMVTATPYSGDSYTFSTGETIIFGEVYYFKVEPIKWRILETSGGTAFILCESIIANKLFDNDSNNYANSEIRAWLNSGFYNDAFSAAEKQLIQTTVVDNSVHSTGESVNPYVCENTNDKIFLLSSRDRENYAYGFNNDASLCRVPSDYSRATGTVISDTYGGTGQWWLRSPYGGYYSSDIETKGVNCVFFDGGRSGVIPHHSAFYGVVPALKIQLS